MTVQELIDELLLLPKDVQVEVNDNRNGLIHNVDQVDHFFGIEDGQLEVVIIQVNC